MSPQPFRILLVEDSPNDVLIIRRALAKNLTQGHQLVVVKDGQEALDYLYQRGPRFGQGDHRPPNLILLDLNLPRVDGFDVLRTVKSDPRLQSIPIVVLTTSERDEDISTCYALGANTFVPKPVEFEHFAHTVQVMHEYWREIARLPRAPRADLRI